MKLRNKKTGGIFDAIIREKGGGDTYSIIVCNSKEYGHPPLARCILGEYSSLAKLYEDWEDYKPLIKDEKIRKAVKAWAEVNKIEDDEKVTYHGLYWKLCYSKVGQASIQFNVPLRISDGLYTIKELCGSEEIEILEPTYTTIEEKEKLKEQE